MFMVFPKQNVEISPLITTRREYEFPEYNVSDSVVYNYQYQYYFENYIPSSLDHNEFENLLLESEAIAFDNLF